jgi:hypothetical protein
MCAVLGGCGGATPAPEAAPPPQTEITRQTTSIAPKNAEPSPSEASVAASPAPASPGAPPPEPSASAPATPAFPDLAESPGAPELEPVAELLRKEQWIAAQVRLSKLFPAFDTSGPIDAVLAGHVLYGRICARKSDARCAEREHRRVIELWEAPGTAAALDMLGGDSAARRDRLARALSAAGEAFYFIAEQKRNRTHSVRMPEYKGESTKEAVTRFVQTEVAGWVKRKTPLLEEAESAYGKILELRPAPPPKWAVAAAARTGALWGRFSAEFRAAPIPEGWKGNGKRELRDFYYQSLDEASEPQKTRAHAAYSRCRDTADRVQLHDENAQACVNWLDKMAGVPEPQGAPPFPRAH